MKVAKIDAFQTSDGKIFTSNSEAISHQEDIIGQLLDDFLPHDDRGNITQSGRYNIIMKQLKDPKLNEKITKLYIALNFTE